MCTLYWRLYILYFLFILSIQSELRAQRHSRCGQNPVALSNFCMDACLVCDLNGVSAITTNTIVGQAPPGYCTMVQHSMQWLAFIAGSTNLSFNVSVSNCTQANGVEMGVYASDDCQTFRLVSNCNTNMYANQTWPFTTTEPLKVGCIYYLVFDGNGPNSCNVDITITSGSTMAPVPNTTAKITGKKLVCKGETALYNIAAIFGACSYEWRVENGTIHFAKDNQAEVSWDQPGIGKICVKGVNDCNEGNEVCLDVEIGDDTPLQEYGPYYVCFGGSYRYNNIYLTAGTWDYYFKNKYGCDSNITVVVEELELLETSIDTTVCYPDTFKFAFKKYDSSGIYKVILKSKVAPYCDSNVFIHLNYPKLISIPNKTNNINCLDTAVVLYGDSSLIPNKGVVRYLWTNKNNDTLGTTSAIRVYKADTYYLSLVYDVDSNHSCFSSSRILVTGSNNFPNLVLTDSLKFCTGDTIFLNQLPFTDLNNTNANYTFHYRNTCDAQSKIDSTYLILSKDSIIYLKASNGSCEDTIGLTFKITSNQSFQIPDQSICFGEELDLSNLPFTAFGGPAGRPLFYNCSIPDSNCLINILKQRFLDDTTLYVYPQLATCPELTNFKIRMKPKPSPEFTLNKTDFCKDDSLVLSISNDSLSTNFTYNLDGAINSISNASDRILLLLNDTGPHTICLKAEDAGCVDSLCKNFQVHLPPVVPIINCIPTDSSILFTWPFYTNENYQVDILQGGNFSRLTDTSIYFYNLSRGQTIKFIVRVSNPYCKEVFTEIECQSKTCPVVQVDIDKLDTICLNATNVPIQLKANTNPLQTGGQWNWRGAGITDSLQGIFDPLLAGPGNHRIFVQLDQQGCKYLASIPIVIRQNPIAEFTLDSIACQDSSIIISFNGANADSSLFSWNLAGGIYKFLVQDKQLEIKWPSPGKKLLSLKLNKYKCFHERFREIEILEPLATPVIFCESTDSTILFRWNKQKRVINYKLNILYGNSGTFLNDTSYLINKRFFKDSSGIQLTMEDGGPCSDVSSSIVECKSPDCPLKNLIADTLLNFCSSNPETLVLNRFIRDPIRQFTWAGINLNGNLLNTSLLGPGNYFYFMNGMEFGCLYKDTLIINIHSDPEIRQLYIESIGCSPNSKKGTAEFINVSTKNPPSYYSLDGISYQLNPKFTDLEKGKYLLFVKDEMNCISDTLIEIDAAEIPNIDLGPDVEILKGESVNLTAMIRGSYNLLEWNSIQALSCNNCLNPLLIPEKSMKIYCLITNEDGCTALDSLFIKVYENKIFAPNVFSPNGDNINDQFTFFGNAKRIQLLEIYNRWGEKIFSKQNFLPNALENGWDGLFNGEKCLPGVYVYYGVVQFEKGEDLKIKGDLSLIR